MQIPRKPGPFDACLDSISFQGFQQSRIITPNVCCLKKCPILKKVFDFKLKMKTRSDFEDSQILRNILIAVPKYTLFPRIIAF